MGDCKKFGAHEEDLTPEQRLDRLESRIPNLIERIQSYDSALADIALLKADMKDVKAYMLNNTEAITSLVERSDRIAKRTESEANLLQFHVESINNNLRKIEDTHEKSYSSHKSSANALQSQIEEQGAKIDSHRRLCATLQDLTLMKKEFASNKEDMGKDLDTHGRWIDQLADDVESYKEEKNWVNLKLDTINGDIQLLKDVAMNLPVALKESENRNVNMFSAKVLEINARLNEACDKLAKSVKPSEQIDGKIKELESSINEFIIDVQNANIRSSNAVKQVAAMEKKIENILLQIKRHELDKP